MALRLSLLMLSMCIMAGCLGKKAGNDAANGSQDDVSVFSYEVQPEAMTKALADQVVLEDKLNEFFLKGNYNAAAFIAANAPEQHDAFVASWIMERRAQLPPPFLYVLSAKADKTDPDRALQWFFRGYVLATVDAKMCLDKSARQGVVYLSNIIKDNARAKHQEYENDGRLNDVRMEALEYAAQEPKDYSPMWICSHGISSFTGGGNAGHEPLENREAKIEEMRESLPKS